MSQLRTSPESASPRIGFVGTGRIGRPMAEQIQAAGFELVVCDVRREAVRELVDAGAGSAETPREVARCSDVVFTSLPGPPEVEAVVGGPDGLLAGARPGLVHVDLSTISLPAATAIREREAQADVHFVDAPVSGGTHAAVRGELTVMASGDRSAFERAEPALRAIGKNVFHLSEEAGTGTLFKLINNAVFLCAGQLLQEGLVLGAKAGIDLRRLHEVLSVSSAAMFCGLAAPTLARGWDSAPFELALAEKDVRLALESARALGVPMPATAAAHGTYADAVSDGLGGKFFIATLAALEQRAGVELPRVDLDAVND